MTAEQPSKMPTIVSQMCIDAATDREMFEFGLKMSRDTCRKFESKRVGGTWTIDSECTFGTMKTVSRTTISGDFQSAITIQVEGTVEEKGAGPTKSVITQTATWKGPCGNLKPGDISLSGITLNVKQLQRVPNIQVK